MHSTQPSAQRTWRILLVSLLLLPLLALGASGSALAQEATPEQERLLLVLDSSGSMREEDRAGRPKIESARSALGTVIERLDEQEQVGLRVFGAEVQGGQGLPEACTDSELVVPVGADNRAELEGAVRAYEPLGDTPIGYALQQAAADLGGEGNRTVMLVSDGLATCDLDPCEVAADIAQDGIDLTIHVVGLDVDAAAREQLQCVADAGRGSYFDADDEESLTATLDRLASRAFRPFSIAGTPVEGAAGIPGAPELTVGEQYTDTITTGTPRHYLVRRTQEGSSLHAGVSALPGSDNRGQFKISFETLAGNVCSDDIDRTDRTNSIEQFVSAQASAYPSDGERRSPDLSCGTDETLVLLLEPLAEPGLAGVPYEIVLGEEPAVQDITDVPAPAQDPTWQPMQLEVPQDVAGGASVNDATPLANTGSFAGELLPGETVFFSTPVDFGQSLQAQVDYDDPGPALAEAISGGGLMATRVEIKAPFRGDGTALAVDDRPATDSTLLRSASRTQIATAGPQVRWTNRTETSHPASSVAGDYIVSVSLSPDPQGKSYLVPYTLTLEAVGTAGEGAPTYMAATERPDDTSTTEAPVEQEELTAAPEEAAGATPLPPDEPSAAAPEPEVAAPVSEGAGTPWTLVLALGAGGLVMLGAGAFALTRTLRS